MSRLAYGASLFLLLLVSPTFAQLHRPTLKPPQLGQQRKRATLSGNTSQDQALEFAAKAISVLTGGQAIADATLSGTVIETSGTTDKGTFTLYAKGNNEGRLDLVLSAGTITEIRSNLSGDPDGEQTQQDGSLHPYAVHNCWTDAVWFFPALSSLNVIGNKNAVFSYLGQEKRGDAIVEHLQFYYSLLNVKSDVAAVTAQASATDIYLDATSLLPVAVTWDAHPDDDALTNMPAEVDFSNYQAVGGVQIPFHIQKYFQGTLFLDMTVSSAVLNTGLSDDLFAIK